MASKKFNIENCRIAFANDLFTAKSFEGSKPSYASSFLIPPTHPAVARLRALFTELATDQWGVKGAQQLKALEATDKLCLHNGDTKSYAGYAGNLYVSARNQTKPRVVDRNANDVSQDSGIIYSGCRVIALLEIWTQDNKFGKRINATLRGVQFFADDERFTGGGAAGEDEFQKLDATEEEDVLA